MTSGRFRYPTKARFKERVWFGCGSVVVDKVVAGYRIGFLRLFGLGVRKGRAFLNVTIVFVWIVLKKFFR